MIKILFVCHGNICRSPMTEFVMKDMVGQAGLEGQIRIASAATSSEELGNPVYLPVRRLLKEHGIDCAGKTARRMIPGDYGAYDLLIGMDETNIRNMRRICGGDPEGKIHLLLEYAGRHTGFPTKPSEAVSLGGGGARERARDARQGVPRQSGLCPDEVADPWYTRDFEATWRDVNDGCRGLLELLRTRLNGGA